MNQSKLIENILKAAKTISSAQGNANYIVANSIVTSILKGMEIRSERKRKLTHLNLFI